MVSQKNITITRHWIFLFFFRLFWNIIQLKRMSPKRYYLSIPSPVIGYNLSKKPCIQLSNKKPSYFLLYWWFNTYCPHNWVVCHPLYTLNNQGPFFYSLLNWRFFLIRIPSRRRFHRFLHFRPTQGSKPEKHKELLLEARLLPRETSSIPEEWDLDYFFLGGPRKQKFGRFRGEFFLERMCFCLGTWVDI